MPQALAALTLLLAGAAAASSPAPQGFSFTGPVTRFVTPNGDGKNDEAVFRYDNPRDSAGSVRLYELSGRQVATVAIEPNSSSASWNPRGYAGGVYIYVVTIDQKAISGTVVVVR
jgi:hypothetical protein